MVDFSRQGQAAHPVADTSGDRQVVCLAHGFGEGVTDGEQVVDGLAGSGGGGS
ncbi:hypothetical protein [Streptomyces sp. NPDC057302]|uniref:hypothetical protein n=1 Tax=Streptomyces sp. NPDC057302 TaxID=3346094 RepID=UPI003630858F